MSVIAILRQLADWTLLYYPGLEAL